MKILHSADLHLGSPLRAASAPLRQAADGVLGRIVDVALAERVEAIVLAGDIFDNAVADVALRAQFVGQLSRAVRAGVPVVMIRGNHDALLDLSQIGPLGEGLHLLTRDAPSVELKGAVFHGISFEDTHVHGSMLPDYPARQPGKLNIGLMHTSLDGAPGHDPYAPVALGALVAHGYDYWALGHIHKRMQHIEAGAAVVMPGIPQGRHAGESAGGTVTLATLGDRPDLRTAPVAEVLFEPCSVDLTGLSEIEIIDALRRAVPQAEPEAGPHRAVRFHLRGSGLPLSALEVWAHEALRDHDRASVEAVRVDQRPGLTDGAGLLALATQQAQSAAFRQEAQTALQRLRAALPAGAQDALGDDDLDAFIQEGLAELAAALGGKA